MLSTNGTGGQLRKRLLAGLIEGLFRPLYWAWRQGAAVSCGNRAERRRWERERARRLRLLPRRMVFEALEARVLLSADLNPAAVEPAAPVAEGCATYFILPEATAVPAIVLGPVTEGQPLTVADGDGTQVTFTLSGAGTAEVSSSSDGFDVNVTGGTGASALTVTTAGGDGRAELHNLTVAGSLQSFSAATLDVTGDIAVSGTLAALTLGDIGAPHQATIGGSGVALSFVAGHV